MTYRGTIKNGTIVLDASIELPEGTSVEVIVPEARPSVEGRPPPLIDTLASVIGKAHNLPPDAALNHDHYLYGTPKRK